MEAFEIVKELYEICVEHVEATGNGILLKCGKHVNRFTSAREEQSILDR